MATKHPTSKKCNISALEQQPKAMDPTVLKNQPKPNTITTSTTKPHPTPADAMAAPSTIQNISSRFAKLYANHKIHASLKGSTRMARSIPHFQEKALNNSCVLDNSCLGLTKSKSQQGRNGVADLGKGSNCTRTKVKEKDKKSIIKKSLLEEVDVEKALARQKFNEVETLALAQKEEKNKKEFYGGKDAKQTSAMMSKSQESHELKKFNEVIEMKRPPVSLALNGRRRKSFCCSQTELADFFSCTGVKVVAVDMPPFMQIHVVDCARRTYDSLEKFTSKTLAFTLKKEFDGVYGPAWHCIVGTSFGSFVTHSVGGFMYFSMDHKLYILLFKTTVQRAD